MIANLKHGTLVVIDVDCKMLEWLSRAAYKTNPFGTEKKNRTGG